GRRRVRGSTALHASVQDGVRTDARAISLVAEAGQPVKRRTRDEDRGFLALRRKTAMRTLRTIALALAILTASALDVAAAPQGQMTWGMHISLAPTWFDPAETTGIVTPFMVMYALHDAMVKPLPGNPLAPSLAESWTVSPDGRTYEFLLRKGTRFHNGDPVT